MTGSMCSNPGGAGKAKAASSGDSASCGVGAGAAGEEQQGGQEDQLHHSGINNMKGQQAQKYC